MVPRYPRLTAVAPGLDDDAVAALEERLGDQEAAALGQDADAEAVVGHACCASALRAASSASSLGVLGLFSARTSGVPRDRGGVSLFIVDRQSPNLHLQSFKTIDGRRAAEITLKGVRVPASRMLGEEGKGVAILEACRDRAIAALCAEAVGAMTELNSATLEYTKTRKQFGVALGTFQVLQHRMVDMFIALQESISLTQHLNLTLAENEPGCSKLASGAKSKVGEAARFVGEQAVQLHGGMGMSDELNIGHYFKRIASINIQFGDPTYHLLRYAREN